MRGSISLTSAGLGAAVLLVPGLLIGIVAQEPALISVVVGFGLLILVNAVWSLLTVQRVLFHISHPVCTTIGASTDLRVDVTNPVGTDIEALVHPDSDRKWITAQIPASGTIKLRPSVRGMFTAVEARVRSSFPLGLVTIHRWVVVPLAEPLHVAPREVRIDIPPQRGHDGIAVFGRTGSPVGVRTFHSGDLRRDIHWPSTARVGSLMVRDRKQSNEQPRLTVQIDLSRVHENDSATTDQVLGWARFAMEKFLAKGYVVFLQSAVTNTSDVASTIDVKTIPVNSSEQMIKALAVAAVGHRFEPPQSSETNVLRASPAGLVWQQTI